MKGYLFTLESMIASILLLSVLLIVYNGSVQPHEFGTVSIAESAYNCLKDLDNRGILRYYALNNDTKIRGYIRPCLPMSLNFSIGFCETCATTNANKTVVSIKYIIAGDGSRFQPTTVNMLAWSVI